MKTFLAITAALVLMASGHPAMAQSDVIAKQRAKNIRDNNNIQQGITPPPAAMPSPGAVPAPPVAPQMNPEQQQNIDKLGTDLTTIKPGVVVTAEQKELLQVDFLKLAKGAVKPSKELTGKLAADLAAGLADKNVSTSKQKDLAKAVNVVVNCVNLTAAQVQTFVASAQTTLKSAGVADQSVTAITADLKAIVTELQKSKPKLYQ